jgi:hypothetical protein
VAFIIVNNNVVGYADFEDIQDADQRLFEANEILFDNAPGNPQTLDEYLDDLSIKSTDRINQKIRSSESWRQYLLNTGQTYDEMEIPAINPNRILSRKQDFTDMCVYYVFKEFLLPKIADFGNPESPELQKMKYYEVKFNDLFTELTSMWDWYDADGDGTVEASEKLIRPQSHRRSRARRSVVYAR